MSNQTEIETPATSAKHTPGPWRISDNGKAIVGRSHSDTVVFTSNGERMISSTANANLIAAAPELLDVARECTAWFELDRFRDRTVRATESEVGRNMLKALANAIAKAEGRSK